MLKKCMTPTCGVCKKLGKMLDDMNIEYEDIDVSENPEFLDKYSITSFVEAHNPFSIVPWYIAFTRGAP